ncbi:retinoic acid-induced protein 1 [Elysia marginata]|uniref:Retinoic acid-induced protein 1 n=1 Tax=Elysia marginata TaxID=1093978 RepID=A0AAV4FL45_9GAST|nr:retinoic acid-induced protein 1 [Elysia marginata]
MNQYPDNYHGYGRDASNMQGMAYGYRESSAMRGHQTPDYHGGYPMSPHHGGAAAARGMYSQGRPGTYGLAYGHYNSSGYMGHQHGHNMVNPYYNSHNQVPGSVEGYNMHHAQHMAMMGPGQQRHPSMMASRGGSHHCTSPASQDHYGAAYSGQGSPTRMHLQHQGHSSHSQVPVPPHPMRQTNAQQNPQEVADNILQMASSYPSNQTVQVPLKNRPAPYHIPRSPHCVPRQEHPQHTSPGPQHQQQVLSTHASASPTSGVKSPISQNPTPSPNPGMLRSPSGQVLSPCGSQRSPSHGGSAYPNQQSTVQTPQMPSMSPVSHGGVTSGNQPQQYQNHHQHHHHHHNHLPHNSHLVQQSDSPHYSPCSMVQSPYSASPSAQAQAAPYSPHSHNPNHNAVPPHQYHQPGASMVMSPPTSNLSAPYVSSSSSVGPNSTFEQVSAHNSNNPLMSLEKLVMLPESQVVDPKSVVNDACLSTQSEEGPKNVEDPAERSTEGLGHSVGCSGVSSSLSTQSVDTIGSAESVSETAAGKKVSQSDKVAVATNGQMGSNSLDLPVSAANLPTNPGSGDFGNDIASQPICVNGALKSIDNSKADQSLSLKQAESPNIQGNLKTPDTEAKNDIKEPSSHKLSDVCLGENVGGFADNQCHNEDAQMHDLPISPNTSQNCLTSINCQSSDNNSDSRAGEELMEADGSLIGSESGIARSGEDFLPETPPKSEKEFVSSGAYLLPETPPKSERELSSKTGNGEEVNSKCDSSGPKFNLNSSSVKSGDEKDLLSQELLLSSPISKNSSFESSNKLSETENKGNTKHEDSSPLALSKYVKSKEEIKLSPVPCHPPCVLSEVPIILNGVESSTHCEADDDQELDFSSSIRSKVHNGLNTFVKSKLGFSRRASHLTRITPCSIAVEASERAVCERFSLRRNGLGRVSHTSTNRERNNSSGNADSDESLENLSSPNLRSSRDPQDGTRKRGPSSTKRNGFSKSAVSSFTKNADNNSSTAQVPLDNNTHAPHGTTAGSEEEPCYYEGVDSSYDVYLNTFSSDESGLSDDKGSNKQSQQQDQITCSVKAEEPADDSTETPVPSEKKEISGDGCVQAVPAKKDGTESEKSESRSPPAKRLKTSPCPTGASEKTSCVNTASLEPNEVIDLTSETISPKCKRGNSSPGKQGIEKFRPSILGRKPVKYPVVVLEKSIISPKLVQVKKENSDLNVSEGSTPQQLTCANLPDVKSESVSCSETANSAQFDILTPAEKVEVINEITDVPTKTSDSISPKKNSPKKNARKRKNVKPKSKEKESRCKRQSDVTDSFKSMKFGCTLDLMKTNRKREGGSIGPFVRVVGQSSSPKTVSVFAQPTAEILAAAKQGKAGAGNKKGPSLPTVTTVSVVSNFGSNQSPMVPSTRTVSQKPWVCAFCGQQSSYKFLGDLFGPYFKESEVGQVEKLALKESKGVDSDKNLKPQELGKKNLGKGHPQGTSKQHRRKSALQPHISEPPALTVPEEIWVHQACALWSPGVCLVGNKMYGLEEAVKDAAENVCSECKSPGAMIGCLHKGCPMKYHFVCAVERDCYLNEENLSCLCPKHKEKKFGSASTSKS